VGTTKSVTEQTGPELVQSIGAGESGAEDEMVRRYSRGVSVLLGRAAGDRAAVEDLYQETFRVCLDKIRRGELREPEKLSGFIRLNAQARGEVKSVTAGSACAKSRSAILWELQCGERPTAVPNAQIARP
jgi:hypothetical protein